MTDITRKEILELVDGHVYRFGKMLERAMWPHEKRPIEAIRKKYEHLRLVVEQAPDELFGEEK